MRYATLLLFSLLLIVSPAFATTYYVCDTGATCKAGGDATWETGNDSNTTTQAQSKATPWKTIQHAEDNMQAGDTCIVGDGTYTPANTTAILYILRNDGTEANPIIFRSENKWGAVMDVNNSAQNGIRILGESDWVTIKDFEIKDANMTCIQIYDDTDHSTPDHITIVGNKIHGCGNLDWGDSGNGFCGIGMDQYSTYYTIDRNIIYHNGRTNDVFNRDHGVYVEGKFHIVKNNIFYDHTHGYSIKASGWVGGSLGDGRAITIINNTFADAKADYGSQITFYNSSTNPPDNTLIENNIFYNAGPASGANDKRAVVCGSTGWPYSGIIVRNNISYDPDMVVPVMEAEYQGDVTYTNNQDNVDPKLTNTTTRDYTLQSDSPAINAGLDPFSAGDPNNYDFADNLVWSSITNDVVGKWSDGVEIGAYGYYVTGGEIPPEPEPPPAAGSLVGGGSGHAIAESGKTGLMLAE